MGVRDQVRSGVVVLLLVTPACYPSAAPPGLTRGLWSGTSDGRQFVVEFTGSHLGVHAQLHTLRGGRRVTEKPAFEVKYRPPWIEVWMDRDLSYRGRVDLDRGRIDGEILGLTDAPLGLRLERVTRESLDGFLARPVSPAGGRPHCCSRPADEGDGWSTASPAETGLDQARLEEAVSAIIAGDAGLIHSLLLVHHGRLVLEEYFHGYGRNDSHEVGTCALGVASLLTGIAIDQGRIAGPAVPLLEFFPELRARAAEGWERVSLEHVLTMTTGSRDKRKRSGVADILALSPTHDPGARWRYSDGNVELLSEILVRATGSSIDEFAATYLFDPLGMDAVEWERDAKGSLLGLHTALRLRPRDLAKLGQLILDGGRWRGRRVVSAEWIRRSTEHRLDYLIAGDEQYGYLWWMPPMPEESGDGRVIAAWGLGSQFLYVMPSLDAVAVLTGGNQFNRKTFLPPHVLATPLLSAFES